MKRLGRWLAGWLIARALRTPYSHIHGDDGTLYMARYWLVPYPSESAGSINEEEDAAAWLHRDHKREGPLPWWPHPVGRLLQTLGIAIRVHNIARPDMDVHMHDHPWPFVSVVLRGGYVERRPIAGDGSYIPHHPLRDEGEEWIASLRTAGSVAVRQAYNRHRISAVSDNVWTLFITFGGKRHTWGFYDEHAKHYWYEYIKTRRQGK